MEFAKTDGITLRQQISQKKLGLLPVGATELHGAHLPTGTDSFLAEALCRKVSEATGGIVLPTLHYTQVWSLGDQIGSISISNNLLCRLLEEILLSVYQNGFEIVAIINTHLGNLGAIKEAARNVLAVQPEFKVLYLTYPNAGEKLHEVMSANNFHGSFFHADEIETSYMLYLCDELVDMGRAVNAQPQVPEMIDVTPIRWSCFSDDAVMGNATLATREKGRVVIEHVVEKMVYYIGKMREE